jgi:hypothetical protein
MNAIYRTRAIAVIYFSADLPLIDLGATMNNGQTQPAAAAGLPIANFPKQAIVVIHGMGEQMPMDTIKGFVRATWETVTGLATDQSEPHGSVEQAGWANRFAGVAPDHDAANHTNADLCRRSSIGLL